jgi:hypothetical protein
MSGFAFLVPLQDAHSSPCVHASRLRALVLALSLSATAGLTLGLLSAASAVSPSTVVAAADYATEHFGDPWDFSNPEDVLLDGGIEADEAGPTRGLHEAEVADGQLTFGVTGQGYFSPFWGGYPGALYPGPRGLYSSQPVPAGIQWFGCEGLDPTAGADPGLASARRGAGRPARVVHRLHRVVGRHPADEQVRPARAGDPGADGLRRAVERTSGPLPAGRTPSRTTTRTCTLRRSTRLRRRASWGATATGSTGRTTR